MGWGACIDSLHGSREHICLRFPSGQSELSDLRGDEVQLLHFCSRSHLWFWLLELLKLRYWPPRVHTAPVQHVCCCKGGGDLITWQWICRVQASSCLAIWTPTWLLVNCQLEKASDFFTLLFWSAAVPYFTLSSFWFCRGGWFLLTEDWIIFWKPGMSAPKRGPRVAYHDPLGQFDFIMKGKKKTLKTAGEKCNNVSSAIVLEY